MAVACAAGSLALLVSSLIGGDGGSGGPFGDGFGGGVGDGGGRGVRVVVAARELPAGRPVGAGDLTEVRVPAGMVPDGVLTRVAGAVGRVPVAAVRRGEALTDVRLRRAGPAGAVGPGLVAAPVRMADAAAVRLLRSGDRIDVLAVDVEPPAEVRTVAAGLPVIEIPPTGPTDEGALLMLAATPTQALALARESTTARLSFTLPAR
ncbi:MAG: hypothetical protein GEV11_20465 [Streptosporangiales bacterium]|nr:hypothetical protein [Streptosporangiales bacterium]